MPKTWSVELKDGDKFSDIEGKNPYGRYQPLPGHHKGFLVDGILTMQNMNVFAAYPALFLKENIARVIEIGTAYGGFAVFLRKYLNYEMDVFKGPIITYDIKDQLDEHAPMMEKAWANSSISHNWVGSNLNMHGYLKELFIDFRVKDCFKKEVFEEIISLIQQPGKTLLVCDGGDKPREIGAFSPHLKKGDIIIGHDYFKNASIDPWLWWDCELQESDIDELVEDGILSTDHELRPLFDKAVSFLGVKIK